VQLDNTRIAIRERGFPEILDLSLRVIRVHGLPLLASLAVGAIPTALLNYWLLSGLLASADLAVEPPGWYLFWFAVLVVWEMPLATAPMTLYLGEALFVEKPSAAAIARKLRASLPQLIVYQIFLRGLLSVIIVTWFVIFALWPYLNEVILLERNPWRRMQSGASSFSRAGVIHALHLPELIGRWLAATVLGAILLASIWFSIRFLREILFYRGGFDAMMYSIYLPLATWLVLGYLAVVRFLSYLDLRIRGEGWEVELQMRAEASRLARQLT
jgi:hypothetical protein